MRHNAHTMIYKHFIVCSYTDILNMIELLKTSRPLNCTQKSLFWLSVPLVIGEDSQTPVPRL